MSGSLRRCVFPISCQLMKRSCNAKLREKVASLGSRTELLALRWQPTLSQQHKFSHSQTPTVDSTLMEEEEEEDSLFKAIEIEVKGHDPAVLNSYQTYITMAARELDITVSKCWTPPKVIERYTLLKSVHIYKKHRVQYETRTHFKTIQLIHLTGSTASTFLEYIQRNLPEGVAMKVTKHRIERLPDHIREPPIHPQIVDTAS